MLRAAEYCNPASAVGRVNAVTQEDGTPAFIGLGHQVYWHGGHGFRHAIDCGNTYPRRRAA